MHYFIIYKCLRAKYRVADVYEAKKIFSFTCLSMCRNHEDFKIQTWGVVGRGRSKAGGPKSHEAMIPPHQLKSIV